MIGSRFLIIEIALILVNILGINYSIRFKVTFIDYAPENGVNSEDAINAFYNRLILIPCERVFEEHEQNKNLVAQLRQELSGIFNWAIEGLNRFKERGNFERHDFMRDAIKELEDDNTPSNHFFNDHIEILMGTQIDKGDLFEKYKLWCDKTKNHALSTSRFSIAVYKKFQLQTPKKAQDRDSGRRIWKNIRYVDFKTEVRGSVVEEEI